MSWWSDLWGGGGDSGGGGGDGWGAIASAILSGIGSRQEGKENSRQARELAEYDRETRERGYRTQGDEQRRTIDFESRLTEANRLNERARLSTAWDAWGRGDSSKPAAKPVTLPNFSQYYVAPTEKPSGK